MSYAIALVRTVPDDLPRIREEIIEYGGVIALAPKVQFHDDKIVSVQVEYRVGDHTVRVMDVCLIGTSPAGFSFRFGLETLAVVRDWIKEAFECEMLHNLPLFSSALELGETFISEHKAQVIEMYELKQEQEYLDDNSN